MTTTATITAMIMGTTTITTITTTIMITSHDHGPAKK